MPNQNMMYAPSSSLKQCCERDAHVLAVRKDNVKFSPTQITMHRKSGVAPSPPCSGDQWMAVFVCSAIICDLRAKLRLKRVIIHCRVKVTVDLTLNAALDPARDEHKDAWSRLRVDQSRLLDLRSIERPLT